MSEPDLVIVDVGTGYLVIGPKQSRMYGKTPYTKLKFGTCKGAIDVSFAGFRAQEVENALILTKDGRSVPVTLDLQGMAEGFLGRNATVLQRVWERNLENVRRLFS